MRSTCRLFYYIYIYFQFHNDTSLLGLQTETVKTINFIITLSLVSKVFLMFSLLFQRRQGRASEISKEHILSNLRNNSYARGLGQQAESIEFGPLHPSPPSLEHLKQTGETPE